jgi:hypothetical protein
MGRLSRATSLTNKRLVQSVYQVNDLNPQSSIQSELPKLDHLKGKPTKEGERMGKEL